MMILSAIAAAASLSACTPIPGAEKLWQSSSTRYVMVGETHGTKESPELFADLVCAAGNKKAVVVAVEQQSENQGPIDAFLDSNGSPESRAQFLKARMWNQSGKDGRSSQAMLELFDRLRQLKQAGRVASVVAFDAPWNFDFRPLLGTPEGQKELNDRDNQLKADQIEAAAAAHPGALVFGYMGSLHVSRDDASNFGIHSAAAQLPAAEVQTVLVDGEGSAWNIINNDSGPHSVSSFSKACRAGVREIAYPPEGIGMAGFDAVACVGKPFTASPAAVPAASK